MNIINVRPVTQKQLQFSSSPCLAWSSKNHCAWLFSLRVTILKLWYYISLLTDYNLTLRNSINTPVAYITLSKQAYHQCVKSLGCWRCWCCCLNHHWPLIQAARRGFHWNQTSCWGGMELQVRSRSLCQVLDPFAQDWLSPFQLKWGKSATNVTELN